MTAEYRRPETHEMDEIYLMGYGAWSDGYPVEEYLAGCRSSKKYQSGRWFVLGHKNSLRAALLVHTFDSWGERIVRGIGSVATQPEFRRLGYGHTIMQSAVNDLVNKENASILFLYSDIGVTFYEQHGFRVMPARYQKAQGSTLMVLMLPEYDAKVVEEFRDQIPRYF